MLDSSIIGVVIGLVFVFSLMAVLVTYINNAVSTYLNLRAEKLKDGLRDLITDERLQAKILAHPLIKMVKATVPQDVPIDLEVARAVIRQDVTNVNYIPPETFVEALKSILIAEASEKLFPKLRVAVAEISNIRQAQLSTAASNLRELLHSFERAYDEERFRQMLEIVNSLPEGSARDRLLDGLREVEQTIIRLRLNDGDLLGLMSSIEHLTDESLKAALNAVLTTARNLEDADRRLTAWFNDGMGRVSTLFQREMQRISLIVAFGLTLILNIDAVHITRILWEDDDLRGAVVAEAGAFADREDAIPITPDADEATLEEAQAQIRGGQETIREIRNLGLPVGWQITPITPSIEAVSLAGGLRDPYLSPRNLATYSPANIENVGFAAWLGALFQKILGIALTTIAAAQGAPFWFDLLRKLTGR